VVWISKSDRSALKEKEGPGSDARPFCILMPLIAVALLNLPQAVLLTSIHSSDRLSARVREFVVAGLAIGIADQIAHVRVIVLAKCL
jgi:hypothetical protein